MAKTALDFGAKTLTDAEITTATNAAGTIDARLFPAAKDNATAFTDYAAWCATSGEDFVLPPGRYYTSAKLSLVDVGFVGTKAFIYGVNTVDKDIVDLRHKPSDKITFDLADVKGWGTWKRYSRKLTGLTNRAGCFVTVSTTNQVLTNRMGEDPIYFAESFLVATNEGDLAHTLYNDAQTANWTAVEAYAYPYGGNLQVSGLNVIICQNGGTVVLRSGFHLSRSNVSVINSSVVNRSGDQVNLGFVADYCGNFLFHQCYVEGLRVVKTNYGFGTGPSAGGVYSQCSEVFCRRGVDGTRAKNIEIVDCTLPDGWGAHWAWWMGSRGGTFGATRSENAQVIQITGGAFHCHDADVVIGGAANSFMTSRTDTWESGASLMLSGNRIIVRNNEDFADLIDYAGPATSFDFGRIVDMPDMISFTDNHVRLEGTNTLVRFRWLRPVKSFNDTVANTKLFIARNSWTFVNGGPNVSTSGDPRIQLHANKISNLKGTGLDIDIRDVPSLLVLMDVAKTTATDPVDAIARMSGQIAADGRVRINYVARAYREIFVDSPGLEASVRTGRESPVDYPPVGDERIVQRNSNQLFNTATQSGFFNTSGAVALAVDYSLGAANRAFVTTGPANFAVRYGAEGTEANINCVFQGKGAGSAILARDGNQRVGFYGSLGAAKATIAPAATDPDTTRTLANDLRAKLIGLGLFA